MEKAKCYVPGEPGTAVQLLKMPSGWQAAEAGPKERDGDVWEDRPESRSAFLVLVSMEQICWESAWLEAWLAE